MTEPLLVVQHHKGSAGPSVHICLSDVDFPVKQSQRLQKRYERKNSLRTLEQSLGCPHTAATAAVGLIPQFSLAVSLFTPKTNSEAI